jgi:hypothetical protein
VAKVLGEKAWHKRRVIADQRKCRECGHRRRDERGANFARHAEAWTKRRVGQPRHRTLHRFVERRHLPRHERERD